ncbi:MAG: MFS transporter [Acidimicrobiaceae bacterium]|nr:MFS transporter [Acidimicrobiaceae bacterium]
MSSETEKAAALGNSNQEISSATDGDNKNALVQGKGWNPGDRLQVAVVSFSHTIQHGYVAALGVAYPFVLADFHISYAVLGIILGGAGIVGALLQGLAGYVRKYSTKFLLGSQNIGMAISLAIAAISPGIVLFGAARIFGTLVSWPQHPVGSAHLTERVPHRRGFVLAMHTTGGNLGTLLAPLITSIIIAYYGWRPALMTMAALTVLASILTWTSVHSPDYVSKRKNSPEKSETKKKSELHAPKADGSLLEALKRREAKAVLGAGMVSGAGRGLGVLAVYIPAYLRSGLQMSPLTIGVLVTMVSIGALGGPGVGGHLSDRFGRRPVLLSLYVLGAAALVGFVTVGSNPVIIGIMGFMVGVFSYSEQPIRQALFSDVMQGVDARKAFGAYFAISQSVGSLWITALGFVITSISFKAAFITMAGSFIVAGLIIGIFANEKIKLTPSGN